MPFTFISPQNVGARNPTVERPASSAHDDGVKIVRRFGGSTLTQTVVLRGRTIEIDTHVDWHEPQKLLKLAFPLDVHADRAASEIQFGHVKRPTHTNTSWDAARFEICAHRWVHVGEPGYGVALANLASLPHITIGGASVTFD